MLLQVDKNGATFMAKQPMDQGGFDAKVVDMELNKWKDTTNKTIINA
jgi:hypothetical protein